MENSTNKDKVMDVTTKKWISGFWRRIGAFFIDSLMLGAVGLGLGFFLEKQFVQLGGWGRFVGFFIALFYFGLLNSKIGNGQTIGKKILNIRVVNNDNQTIDLIQSIARYSIFGVPYFLNGAHFTTEAMKSFWVYPICFIIFGGLLSAIYLYVFNRATRQSLHDLAVGTYVVNSKVEKTSVGPVWRTHLIVVSILFLASAIAPVFLSKLMQKELFKDLIEAQEMLSEQPAVNYVAVSSTITSLITDSEDKKNTKYFSARVFIDNASVTDTAFAKKLATILATKNSRAPKVDFIQIILIYGYDIGISSSWISRSHDFRPADLIREN